MTKQTRAPKRSKAELLADLEAAHNAATRKHELRRAGIHIHSAKLEADMGALADAAANLRAAADIYERHSGETVEIDAE